MTIFQEFCAYSDLLAQDVDGLSPATMATLSGFGKLGDYDPLYLEILEDVRQCADLFVFLSPELRLATGSETRFANLRGRDMNDSNLEAERAQLARDLDAVRSEALRLGEEAFCRLWKRVPHVEERAFIERLKGAGLGATAEDAPNRPSSSGGDSDHQAIPAVVAPRRGEPVYLSSFIERDLARQIIPTLQQFGMRPVMMREPPLGPAETEQMIERIASCRGAVLRFAEDGPSGQEIEIREGLKHFPDRLLILGGPGLVERPPQSVAPSSIFPLAGGVMSPSESVQFATLLSNTWSVRGAP